MKKGQKGFALVMVLSLCVVIITVIAEIIFQTEITTRAALGERDRLNAEMSALTGVQFVKMLFVIQSKVPEQAKKLGDKYIFQLFDDFPIGSDSLQALGDMSKINLNAAMDSSLLDALKVIPGHFVIKSTDESAKLNLNLAAQQQYKDSIYLALTRLFSRPHERRFLEEKGFTPKRLAANVVDYIDQDTRDSAEVGSDEESPYMQAKFTHKAKNGPLLSLEELRRVPGFNDDEIYDVFSPYFTVWPMKPTQASLNVNTVPVEVLAALVTGEESDSVNEEAFDEVEELRAKGEEKTEYFKEWMNKLATGGQVPDPIWQMATGTSTVFKVDVLGSSGGVERHLTYVFQLETKKDSKGGGSKPPPPTPAGGAKTPGNPENPSGTDTAAPKPEPSVGFKMLYQRFD